LAPPTLLGTYPLPLDRKLVEGGKISQGEGQGRGFMEATAGSAGH